MIHDADYFRQRRRALGIPERDPFDHPDLVSRGREMAAMMREPLPPLTWPPDLYAQTKTTAPLYRTKVPQSTECACGCQATHNHAVSKVLTEMGPAGLIRSIVWFRSMTCRQRWEARDVRE